MPNTQYTYSLPDMRIPATIVIITCIIGMCVAFMDGSYSTTEIMFAGIVPCIFCIPVFFKRFGVKHAWIGSALLYLSGLIYMDSFSVVFVVMVELVTLVGVFMSYLEYDHVSRMDGINAR